LGQLWALVLFQRHSRRVELDVRKIELYRVQQRDDETAIRQDGKLASQRFSESARQ
jgi:hypothetical protein